ncbi:MAG: transporter substrate-binding domain-containing protein, partial [Alphaproteobacteria bacterium]
MKSLKYLVAGAATAILAFTGVASAATLDDVRAKGHVQCGVSQGLPGFSNPDENNNWSGIDVDLCRAVAAAIFDDPNAVRFTP